MVSLTDLPKQICGLISQPKISEKTINHLISWSWRSIISGVCVGFWLVFSQVHTLLYEMALRAVL